MSFPVETDEYGDAIPPVSPSVPREELKRKILDYVDRLAKKDPDMANELRKHVDSIVTWFIVNKRPMKMADLTRIIDGFRVKDSALEK